MTGAAEVQGTAVLFIHNIDKFLHCSHRVSGKPVELITDYRLFNPYA